MFMWKIQIQVFRSLLLTVPLFFSIASAFAEETVGISQQLKIIPLKNAGFEDADPKKPERPADWQGYNWISSDQAHSGKKALKLGNFQWAGQKFTIAPEDVGKNITARFYAKGKGELQFFFSHGKTVEKKEIGTHGDWKSRQAFFALSDEYMPYSYTMIIPPGTEYSSVSIGASHPVEAYIDDVTVTIGGAAKKVEASTGNSVIPEPENDKLVNIAPYAKVRTDPWGFNAGRMVDGIQYTGLHLSKHPWKKSCSYEFRYDKPQTIAGIRFSLASGGFVIWADTTGDGKYDKGLVMEEGYTPGSYWGSVEWPFYGKAFYPYVKAYAVKLTTFSKSQAVFEFEIFSPSKTISPEKLAPIALAKEVPMLEQGAVLPPVELGSARRYLQGYHVEPWMFDCPGWIKKNPRPPLKDWPPFQKMMAGLREMNCNLVWLFPPKTWDETITKGRKECTYKSDVMWPSQVHTYSYQDHLLKEFCDELHGAGMEVFTQDRDNSCKITKPDNVPETPVFSWVTRELFKRSGAEMAAEGVDGVPVCVDEAYFGGAPSFKLGKEDPKKTDLENKKIIEQNKSVEAARKAFAERWKLGDNPVYPEKREDTELFRKWQIFYYEQIASFMDGTSKYVKKSNPKAKTVSNLVAFEAFNNRAQWGVAEDIIGWNADIDYLGTDPYHTLDDVFGCYTASIMSKSLIAGNRKKQTIVTLNGPWGWGGKAKQPGAFEVCPPISIIGSVLGAASQGCQAYAFWRYYNIVAMEYGRHVGKAFEILDTMAAWGSREASMPKDIAVLRSRASEDWWQLKYAGDFSKDSILPYIHYLWTARFLMSKGYPYELFYMEQPESYKNLSAYKLIILPFPYSVSKEACAKIEEALKAGSKVIAMGARGETDEIGNACNGSPLKKLIEEKKIEFIDDKIEKVGDYPEFNKKFKGKLDELLGERKTLDFNSYGLDVQVGCLEKSPSEKFVVMINWSGKDCPVDLGVRMPEGKYRLLMRTLDGAYGAKIGGKEELSAKDLSSFRVLMKNGEAIVLFASGIK
jgi:hypothetical protein